MKNSNHQQHEIFKNFHGNAEGDMEKIQSRGRVKKNSQKRKVNSDNAQPQRKVAPARKSIPRFVNDGNFFSRESLTEPTFGHDDYQFRKEFGFDRFATDDITSAFSPDTLRGRPIELEEEKAGTYSDQQLIQEIRRAIERDSAVSSAVQKIQMTAKNGVVMLKGTVASEQEQMIIEDKAVALAGFGQVVNQLEVIEDIIE